MSAESFRSINAGMKLHPDQALAVDTLVKLLATRRTVCAVAPTGSGKTVVGAALISRRRGTRVLWLAHRYELLTQAMAQLVAAGVPVGEVGLLSGVKKKNADARVLVASVGMFNFRDAPSDVQLIVIDECHRVEAASYQAILAELPDARVLGLTATPQRLDGKPLKDSFNELLVMGGQTELIAAKRIASPVTYGVPYDKARKLIAGVKSQLGDYQVGQLGRAMKGKLMGDVVAETCRLAPGLRTLVFAVNREHGRALAERYKVAGRATEYLDGETPAEERRDIITRLESGETEVIVNIDVLTEGFDCPAVKCIVLARPTKSLTRFLQYCGRASRLYEGKRPIIIDNAGNCWRFGLPNAERTWTLEGRPKGESEQLAVKLCKECEAMIPIAAQTCPECGAEQPVHERELEEQRAELERLKAADDDRERMRGVLRKLAAVKGLGEDWVELALREAAA